MQPPLSGCFTVFSHPRNALGFGLRDIHPLGSKLCDAVHVTEAQADGSIIADIPEDASPEARRIQWRFTPLPEHVPANHGTPPFFTCHGVVRKAGDGAGDSGSADVGGAQEMKEGDQVAARFENHMRTQGRLLTFSHGGIMPAWDFFPLIYSTFEKAMLNKTITMAHDNNEATVQIGVHSTTTGVVELLYKSDKDHCRFGLVVLCKA